MAYQQKRSSVVGKVPTVADFGSDTGQLIINTADGKIYMLVGGVVRAFSNDDDLPATAPIGSVIMMASDDKIVPPGCLLMNGAPVTATYPELRAHGIAAGWERNAAGDPLTPDMGGYFPRGWRPGQLVDAGRVFGSAQEDALQNITGEFETADSTGLLTEGSTPKGAFKKGAKKNSGNPGSGTSQYAVAFDASLVARTANETRPINRTFTYWVKAYPAKVDTGSIDLANLTRDIQGVATSVSDLDARTQVKLNEKIGFYTGSDANEINFPIGHYVVVPSSGKPARNSTATIRLASDNAVYSTGGSGAVLAGVWRQRGYFEYYNNFNLYQRVS